jgi:hypothetical protein
LPFFSGQLIIVKRSVQNQSGIEPDLQGELMGGDTTVQSREPPRVVTFEEAWAMIQETGRQLREMIAETDRQIGKLGNRLGGIIEHIMSPKLHKKFEDLGFRFNRSSRNNKFEDHGKKRLAEADILLENGDYAMAVEVKTRLTTENVRDHTGRMEILRQVADERNDTRKYLGAVAGAVVDQNVLAYALKNGFYVIIPSGETVDIEAPDSVNLRIW